MDSDTRQEHEAPAARAEAVSAATLESAAGGGNWTQTGSMSADRLWHTATRLADGRVLVTGGYNPSTEVYSPARGTWTLTGSTKTNHRFHTATLLSSGRVLVVGGEGASATASAEVYDAATGTWAATGNLLTFRSRHAAVLLPSGRVLVVGGLDSNGVALAAAELYDPATEQWTATGSLGTARSRHTVTLLPSGQVLVSGGEGAGGPLASAELYDPATEQWTVVGGMGVARANHTATALPSGKVLVTGGASDGQPATRAELYDPASRSWSATQGMGKPRRNHTATLLPTGQVLVAGGYDNYTGIQTAAELYDVARGTWRPVASMGGARYSHTATLLDNGQVLVAGGFSTGSQSSVERFDATHLQTVLESGTGWRLVNISGIPAPEDEVQPYNTDVYVVDSQTGIEQAPLPTWVREQLAQQEPSQQRVHIISPWVLEEIRITEQTGVFTKALLDISTPVDTSQPGFQLASGCPDLVVSDSKRFQVNKPFDLSTTQNLGSGFSGTLSAKGVFTGNVLGEVGARVRFRRVTALDGFIQLSVCAPYDADPAYFRTQADASLEYNTSLTGQFHYATTWQKEVVKVPIAAFVGWFGPIPITVGFNMPLTVGLTLDAGVEGTVSLSDKVSASLNIDNTCTLDDCTSSGSSSFAPFQNPVVSASTSARVQPSPWTDIAIRGYFMDEKTAYGQVGVRPMLHGDLWGRYDSECGNALTFDADWQISLTAQVSAGDGPPKTWDNLWSTGRKHIGFWNLEGSSAIHPVLDGPASGLAYVPLSYGMKMRPCWLYGDDITYQVDWGDGTFGTFSGPPQNTTSASHAWSNAGAKLVQMMAVRDAHGRQLNGAATSLNVQINPNTPPPPPPPEDKRLVSIDGAVVIRDDESAPWEDDEYLTIDVHEQIQLDKDTRSVTLPTISGCAGGEVRLELDITLTLDPQDNSVVTTAVSRLYEGTSCSTTDLETTGSAEVRVAKNGTGDVDMHLVSDESGNDEAIISLDVNNAPRQ